MNRRITRTGPTLYALSFTIFVASCGGRSSYTAEVDDPAGGGSKDDAGGRAHGGSAGRGPGGAGPNGGNASSAGAGTGPGGASGHGASGGIAIGASGGAAPGSGGTASAGTSSGGAGMGGQSLGGADAGGANAAGAGGTAEGLSCFVEGVSHPVSPQAFKTGCGTCTCTEQGLVCSIQGCLDVCSTLSQTYQKELLAAVTCNPIISRPQCTIPAPRGFTCSCPGYVESAAALERAESAKSAWQKARCRSRSEVACAPCPPPRQGCNFDAGFCY